MANAHFTGFEFGAVKNIVKTAAWIVARTRCQVASSLY